MANYHRNTADDQVTKKGKTTQFRSLQKDFAALATQDNKSFVAVDKVGQTEQGQDIQVLKVGREPSIPILICGGHWAREWISIEIPYLFAEYLVTNYSKDPRVQRIVDGTEIWFVPLMNPDGHERTVLKNRLWCKNDPSDPKRESVNINRNYNTASWKTLKAGNFSTKKDSDLYKGPEPGYATEVQAMQKFVQDKQFKGMLSYHSFGRFIVYPWAGKSGGPASTNVDNLATTMKSVIDSKGIPYEKAQDNLLYSRIWGFKTPKEILYPGSLTDYVTEQIPSCIALGILLEPGLKDPRGNVLPESEIQPTFERHRAAMLTFLNCVITTQQPPVEKRMKLNKPGISSALLAYQTDCSKAFPAADY